MTMTETRPAIGMSPATKILLSHPKWPRDNQAALMAFYGSSETEVERQRVQIKIPFRLYYDKKPATSIRVHKKCAASFERVFQLIWDYYGHDQALIDKLHISEYCGAFIWRMVRGSTTKLSNHSFAAAIDLYCSENGFNKGKGKMPMPVVAAFKSEGARWGGDYQGRTDPMHFEFCDGGDPVRSFEEWLAHYGCPPAAIKSSAHVEPLPPPTISIVVPPTKVTADLRHRMADTIIRYEARRDAKNHLVVFNPPDGSYEVAGVNSVHHPADAAKLRTMINAKMFEEAETYAQDFVLNFTRTAEQWTKQPGIEFFMRDCVYNRGPKGAVMILQKALGGQLPDKAGEVPDGILEVDGEFGDGTRNALASAMVNDLFPKLRAAREWYEDFKYPTRRRSNQWAGMVNRFNNSLRDAQKFQLETAEAAAPTARGTVAGTVATAGTAAATTAKQKGWGWDYVIPIIIIAAVLVFVGWKLWPKKEEEV